jgi:hypothetical protein
LPLFLGLALAYLNGLNRLEYLKTNPPMEEAAL